MNEEGVSEMIGTILLVGITVTVAAVFGLALMSTDGPQEHQYSEMSYKLSAGPDGVWDTGDEQIRIRHAGGEDFRSAETTIRLILNGTVVQLDGGSLDQGFSDGTFRIGETWTYTVTAAQNESVEASTIVPGQLQSTWKNGNTVSTGVNACSPDGTPPLLNGLSLAPSALDTDSTGGVLVTISATDACGLDTVELTYDVGGAPTTVAMTGSPRQATIPDLGWSGLGGQTLTVSITATDNAGNTANAGTGEFIDQIAFTEPFVDANCDGTYNIGDTALVGGELDDGSYTNTNNCVVLPSGWGAQSRDSWNVHVGSLIVDVDLTASSGNLELRTREGDLDIQGVTLQTSDLLRLRAEEGLLAQGATITGEDIDIDEDGPSTTMDFTNATLTAVDDHINIRNDGQWVTLTDAALNADVDIVVRAEGMLNAARSNLMAGDDIILRGDDGVDLTSADHTAVDNLVLRADLLQGIDVDDYCGLDDNNIIVVSSGLPFGFPRAGCGVIL